MLRSRRVRPRVPTALLLLVAACGDASRPSAAPVDAEPGGVASAPALPSEDVFLRQIDRTRGSRDDFQVLREPEFVPAAAAPRMDPEELVLGLDLGEVEVAYPVNYLNFHEIVEHELAGLHLLACW